MSRFLGTLVLAMFAGIAGANAQAYPTRPITLVVPSQLSLTIHDAGPAAVAVPLTATITNLPLAVINRYRRMWGFGAFAEAASGPALVAAALVQAPSSTIWVTPPPLALCLI